MKVLVISDDGSNGGVLGALPYEEISEKEFSDIEVLCAGLSYTIDIVDRVWSSPAEVIYRLNEDNEDLDELEDEESEDDDTDDEYDDTDEFADNIR